MIDCSHANSGKDPAARWKWPRPRRADGRRRRAIGRRDARGNLLGGAQDWQAQPLVYAAASPTLPRVEQTYRCSPPRGGGCRHGEKK